ncbi:MAG: phage tail assembly chaperone [Rhodobiaceae bacterium]|nr:phage tail assembly chaperone [Rhodobiaceae bacterium]MCC0055917.1 phage tail assembly chaperone [Rhodobiaceae bacterium]
MRPAEFWALTPTEFWWLVEANRPVKMYFDMTETEVAAIYAKAYPEG